MMNFRAAGLTKTLLFSVLSIGFGSSFLYGFNIGVINTPQTVMGQWIRDIECRRTSIERSPRAATTTTTSIPVLHGNSTGNATAESANIWCRQLNEKQRQRMFKRNPKLNAIWTAVASVFCVGGLLGSLISNPIVRKFGRKGTLLLNNGTGIIAAILLATPYFLDSFELLMIGRFVAGLNGGITSAVAPLYMTEIPPMKLRGALGGFHQFFIVFAILIAQVLGHPALLGTPTRWPYLFGFGLIPCIFQLLTLPFCPESPKHLYLGRDKEAKAAKALKHLRGSQSFQTEMEEMRETKEDTQNDKRHYSILDLFRDPFLRQVTFIAMIMTASGHASGHGTVIYYSTSVFKSAGMSSGMAVYATIGMGALYAVSTFITAALVEKAGRRQLMLIGLGGMCILTALLSVFMVLYEKSHATPDDVKDAENSPLGDWTPYASVACIYLHTVIYSIGPGTIPAFLVSEMFTQGPRGAATSISLATNWLTNLLVVLAFPLIQAQIEGYTFIIFAVLLAFYFVYTYWKIPETRGKETEQILDELRKIVGVNKVDRA
ncbi:Solute carrier family 2, facilitated glucose transporter member 1 [Hypsibius exemplaris]|uniref:Solute carrier family 2, facilitated glucose transporter member 1 n=2 Tax=Hypsibius exemplaris TaxID=2072580 RepID=A0A1W0WQ67_HYPEX|nr:Solute carrier family 2, facilitated glucose transporter member 1 [Hypsibius exemplaris]